MKLSYNILELVDIIQPVQVIGKKDGLIEFISIDTRKIFQSNTGCFVALEGTFRKGSSYVNDAYSRGIRCFIIDHELPNYKSDACYLLVENSLKSLQSIAAFHRKKYDIPVVAITGSVGKTTIKEWIYHLLETKWKIVRSPKSYNSQIGVALSLLELNDNAEIAIIEAGISQPGEMEILAKMISPTHAIFTGVGTAHLDNFKDQNHLKSEKLILLKASKCAFSGMELKNFDLNYIHLDQTQASPEIKDLPLKDEMSKWAAGIAISFVKTCKWAPENLDERVSKLTRLAMRLETFNGKNNSIVINDTYNLDLDALYYSLEYMQSISLNRPRCIYVGLDKDSFHRKEEIEEIVLSIKPDWFFVDLPESLPSDIPENAIILVKGTRKANMERFASRLREKQHQTKLEIDVSALKENILYFKSKIKKTTKILAMVKAQSYGVGLEELAGFLEAMGVHYLGVAYTSEGVALRKAGIKLPILVMNADHNSFMDCITYQLEPSIYSFKQLDYLIRTVIESDSESISVHIKVDTGMRRLGFESSEIKTLIETYQAQPEIDIKGVYSHLADADNANDLSFTQNQIQKFDSICVYLESKLTNPLIRHISNSAGILSFPEAQFDMVRIGIGMYGLSNVKKGLSSVIRWKSVISQIKIISAGESIGYNRTFIANKNMQIGIIPVGYGDGYSRSLGNGVGWVYFNGEKCPTLGRVCMDMIMVDLTGRDAEEGDEVILFENNDQLIDLANAMGTIPYEVLTSISQRIHRTYVSE